MSKKPFNAYEVNYANYLIEFMRFYDNQKSLCDEIAGLKKRVSYSYDERTEFYIKKENFVYAIRRLSGFLINNIHYITDKTKAQYISGRVEELESRFNNDKVYSNYINRVKEKKELSMNEKIDYNIRYFRYVYDCFDLSYTISEYLQDSLMVSVGKITKSLLYYDTNKFYENLSNYRSELSNNISNFTFQESLDHFKRVIAFHYTYRLFISKKDTFFIDKLSDIAYSFIISKENIDLMGKSKYTPQERERIYNITTFIKNILARIYILTNAGLSEKRILPKVKKKILIDKTLI